MAALTSQSLGLAGTTPSAVAVSASDTIAAGQFGPNGVILRVINAGGSPDTVTITDPGFTPMSSAPTNPSVSVPATTGVRMIQVPPTAINQTTQVATISHSFTTTVTVEVYRV
jgi:hypothetical protein